MSDHSGSSERQSDIIDDSKRVAQKTPFSDYSLMFAKDKPSGLEGGFHTHRVLREDLVLLSVYAAESRHFQVLSLVIFVFL